MIALNESLKKEVETALVEHCIDKDIYLIPQSETEFEGGDIEAIRKELSLSNKKYVLFPASMRKVKDILFALKEMNKLIDNYGI